MSIKTVTTFGCSTLLLALAPGAIAHHAFAAVFSGNDPVQVAGTVAKVEWMNPHTWFYVDVLDGESAVRWAFEMGSPSGLVRMGWSRKTLQPGLEVRVDGYRAKDGSNMASVKQVTLADGRALSGLSSKGD